MTVARLLEGFARVIIASARDGARARKLSSPVGHLTDSRIFSVSMKRVIKPAVGASNTR